MEDSLGTNSEFGFDYLRDNMAVALEGLRMNGYSYAIVDEVDSILIDEARTPLIISGEPETAAKIYHDFAPHREDARGRAEQAQDEGPGRDGRPGGRRLPLRREAQDGLAGSSAIEKVERALGVENLYDPSNVQLVNHLIQALKAEALYKRDVDYVVQDGEVRDAVDEFTGRIMEGRRLE